MARPLKPFVRSGGYYPSAKYTPLVYPGGYTTLNAKNGKPEPINTFLGKIVMFLAKRSLPMVKLEANFTPIQSGTGDPSPENIRPISGHTGCDIFDKAEYDAQATPTVSISFGSTVYGGTLTVNEDGSGQIEANMVAVDMGSFGWKYVSNYVRFESTTQLTDAKNPPNNWTVAEKMICSRYKTTTSNNTASASYNCSVGLSNNGYLSVRDTSYTDAADFKTAVTGQTICYELATPITIPVTAQQIQTLVGTNVVWVNDSDNIQVTAYGSPIT